MNFLILGFLSGMSLIVAIGAQNIFVVEQGLKKQFIFLVCLICSISDVILIFLGIFIFNYFKFLFTPSIEIILNTLLLIFLLNFIWKKARENFTNISFNQKINNITLQKTIFRTLGFTYLNPHVYSDTVFFLGNFSKDFVISQKIYFGIGASISSFIFFYSIGYLAKYFSKYLNSVTIWKTINKIIIFFMLFIIVIVLQNLIFGLKNYVSTF